MKNSGARLPTSWEWIDMARVGCHLGFGPNRAALRRRLAHYVASILHGAAVAELPIEQPTAFELALNLATARFLGITVPVNTARPSRGS
jgi:putative tryptophan/tyrosine transport system substrate-binding protein